MKMLLVLYYTLGSPPCWAVLKVDTAFELQFDLELFNVTDKNNFPPEYLKIDKLCLYLIESIRNIHGLMLSTVYLL